MKKLYLILFFAFVVMLLRANIFWNNEDNYKQIISVENIISYTPSVVNFVYGDYGHWEIKSKWKEIRDNKDYGYYFSDSVQWNHMFNIFPIFQTGFILKYEWFWGLKTFAFTNMYRICGFNFDVYNLSFNISTCDMGFAWYKYKWTEKLTGHNNEFCFIISPITAGISYRIKINKTVEALINCGYSMLIIIDNDIKFPNTNIDASMLLQNSFNAGLGFRFNTKKFKE